MGASTATTNAVSGATSTTVSSDASSGPPGRPSQPPGPRMAPARPNIPGGPRPNMPHGPEERPLHPYGYGPNYSQAGPYGGASRPFVSGRETGPFTSLLVKISIWLFLTMRFNDPSSF